MVAIGVGGADAVDVMTGMEWELKMPKLIGVKLTGSFGIVWALAEAFYSKLAGISAVKMEPNAIIEYFGQAPPQSSATRKATISKVMPR